MPHDPDRPKTGGTRNTSKVIYGESWSSPQFAHTNHLSYNHVGAKGWKFSSLAKSAGWGRDEHPRLKKTMGRRIEGLLTWTGTKVAGLTWLDGDVEFAGLPEQVTVITTHGNRRMAFVEIGDFSARVEVAFPANVWDACGRAVAKGHAVRIKGHTNKDADGQIKVVAEYAQELS